MHRVDRATNGLEEVHHQGDLVGRNVLDVKDRAPTSANSREVINGLAIHSAAFSEKVIYSFGHLHVPFL